MSFSSPILCRVNKREEEDSYWVAAETAVTMFGQEKNPVWVATEAQTSSSNYKKERERERNPRKKTSQCSPQCLIDTVRDSSLGNPLTHSRKCSIIDCTPLPRLNNPLNGFLFIIEDNIYNSIICIWIQSGVTIRVSSGLGEWGRRQRLHMWRFRTSDHDTEHPPLPLLNMTLGTVTNSYQADTQSVTGVCMVY